MKDGGLRRVLHVAHRRSRPLFFYAIFVFSLLSPSELMMYLLAPFVPCTYEDCRRSLTSLQHCVTPQAGSVALPAHSHPLLIRLPLSCCPSSPSLPILSPCLPVLCFGVWQANSSAVLAQDASISSFRNLLPSLVYLYHPTTAFDSSSPPVLTFLLLLLSVPPCPSPPPAPSVAVSLRLLKRWPSV
jgi:hypothetical protein